MKKILGLAIVLVLIASMADATPAVKQKYIVDSAGLIAAAKASLSAEGVEKLQQALAKETDGEQPVFYSPSFFELALRPDLKRDDIKRVKKFLKLISDRRLVTCIVSGGSGKYKGRGKHLVTYSLDVTSAAKDDQNAKISPADHLKDASDSGNVYYLVVDQSKPGEKSSSGGSRIKIRLPR